MRLTLLSPVLPDRHLDVEVEPGLAAGDLRRRLAVLTGDVRWAAPRALLEVAGSLLDDHHPVGAPPLLPGAHLAPGPGPHDDVEGAVGAGVHVAVLSGAGTGRLLPLVDGARVRVPVPAGPGGAWRRALSRSVGPAHVEVRRQGPRVTVRAGGTRVTTLRPRRPSRRGSAGSRGRPVGVRPRTWSPRDELRVGGTRLQLRGAGDDGPRGGRRPHVPPWAWTAVASAGAALVLAVTLRQPVLLLTAVTGLVALVGLRAAWDPDVVGTPARTAAPVTSCADVAALRLTTGLRLRDHAAPVPGDVTPWPADHTLALVGPRDRVLAVARALVLRTLGAGTSTRLVLRSVDTTDWRWTRWWGPSGRLPEADEEDVLVVADGSDPGLGAWRVASPRARLLLVVPPGAAVPAWATTVLRTGDGPADGTGPEAVDADVADAQARAAAALAWLLSAHGTTSASTPTPAPALGELPRVPEPDAAAVARAWAPERPRVLVAPLGTAAGGAAAVLDLVRDGPHALVAGTTGAGKSELLTTVVLGLALQHPPRRLAVLLVDFKGGTGLGPLARLPHVVDHVHDLDVAAARRTLVGLRAELRRREHLLAAAGCTDVADLDPAATPARLLVVVDELRALVDDVPDAAATLSRLAAQGRALGVHLLLATQRPAGAVPPDLRANVTLRIALRVADEEDSRDVVGCPDAAHLPVTSPGSALVRIGSRPVTPLQVARARHRRTAPPVRLARALPLPVEIAWRAARAADDDVAAWVSACREAARGLPGTAVPWLPALPDRVTADVVGPGADADGLLVAVADVPDQQRRTPVRWAARHGPLLVLGGPRSGRSTTLLTVASHALLEGAHVHAVGLPGQVLEQLRTRAGEQLGTTLPVDDVHRALLLLDRLVSRPTAVTPTHPAVLLLDGLDALLDALATHARGVGVDLLTALLRHPPPEVRVAATGPVVPALSRLVGAFGLRLVLPVPDPALDTQAGVPHVVDVPRTVPGRAVACGAEGVLLCQVVLPTPRAPAARRAGSAPEALRIGALPERSVPVPTPARGGTDARGGVPLGTGGDGPGPVDVDPARTLVVAGPPGSGRTTALQVLARGWAAAGRRVVVLSGATTQPARDVPHGVVVVGPADAAALLDRATGPGRAGDDAVGTVLLVDDVDLLERVAPQVAERVEGVLETRAEGLRVVALATTGEHAASAYRGAVATALRDRHVLVLDPHGPATSDLLGPTGALHADPRARPPGRGVLRRGRELVRVQVHDTADHGPRAA